MIRTRVRINSWIKVSVFEQATVRKTRQVTRALFDGFVQRSPVDTGSFRASWNISLGAPNLKTVNHQGYTTLPPPKFVFPKGFKLGMTIYIANGQPYAERLEYGWSQQAPTGVVRVTVASVKIMYA